MSLVEVQIDRIVGPTHHFGGLGVGNMASQEHTGQRSNPAAAAIQGLDKMRLIASLGVPQMILPPQVRPDFRFLRRLGFAGSDQDVLRRAAGEAPRMLSAATSSSAVWTANAATVSAACDNARGLLTLTVANLNGSVHRALEPAKTRRELRLVLPREHRIMPPLPGGAGLRDEGAANHMRLSGDAAAGLNVFVYGDGSPPPVRHWPRQTREACEAIVRQHELTTENVFLLRQSPAAVDAGAFHNDVVASSHGRVLLYHEEAFEAVAETLPALAKQFERLTGESLQLVGVASEQLTLQESIQTYLFNSQIIDSPVEGAAPVIVCPAQVQQHAAAHAVVQHWVDEQRLFSAVHYVDLQESMSGGGGPACLRLRVPIPAEQVATLPKQRRYCRELDEKLREAIEQTYPSSVSLEQLSDIDFIRQAKEAEYRVGQLLGVI